MKTERYIDEFINKEKQLQANPFLSTRIMASIEQKPSRATTIWRTVAVAASISVVVFMGVKLGGLYDRAASKTYATININDSEIENFAYYNTQSYE